jgi:peptide/nickel transport system permease protein
MTLYVLRRLGLLLVAIIVASIVIFVMLRLMPGDLARVIGGTQASPDRIEEIRRELGLDEPLVAQYLDWISGILHGDFGTSALNGETVTSQLGTKMAVTAPLVLASTVLSVLVAVPLGIVAGARHRHADGISLSVVSQLGIAVPTFWAGNRFQ